MGSTESLLHRLEQIGLDFFTTPKLLCRVNLGLQLLRLHCREDAGPSMLEDLLFRASCLLMIADDEATQELREKK